MHLVRVSTDVWGQRVLEGVSWDLLPVAAVAGAAVVIGHALYLLFRRKGPEASVAAGGAADERIERHARIDRLFHWLTALSVLTLLATGFLPVLGVKFPWVTIHWITGVLLVILVLFHTVRATIWQSLRTIGIALRDLSRTARAGKYSIAQKLMHDAMTAAVIAVAATGVLMLLKIDTPFWKRNPYVFGADTWGFIYVLHGLGALLALTLVIIHVYFALIPENRMYLRAMLRGWMTRGEAESRHDPERWPAAPR
jgi:cytochrome b subunit of formate dehydrogenase